ncbi:MAG: ABC transporter ATP-binding protein/permease [Vicinamibacteria bacterium]|nr:ABC transporter ATP-binding protein/permease [Vicinamibacteria bacterium]
MLAAFLERYRLLSPSERRAWRLLSVMALFTVGVETLMGGLVYSSVAYLTRPETAQYSTIMGFIVARLPGETAGQKSIAFLVLLGAVHLVRSVAQIGLGRAHLRLATGTAYSLSCRLFDLYLAAPYSFHLRRHSTELQGHVFHNSEYVLFVLNGGVNLVTQALTVAGLLAVVIKVSPGASVITALAIGTVLHVFLKVTRNLQYQWSTRQNELSIAAYRHLLHGLGAIKELRVVGREGFFGERFRTDRLAALELTIKQHSLGNLPRLLIEAIFGVGVLAAVSLGTGGDQSQIVPLLSLYAYVGVRAIPAAIATAREIGSVRTYIALTEPVLGDLRRLSGRPERPPVVSRVGPPLIELRDIRFQYEGARKPALEAVHLQIRPGEMLGLVGASGAGKTTLGDVILGLHSAQSGSILVDGVEATGNIRGHVRTGYVPQTLFMMDDTVRRNIALGVDDPAIDEERVLRAIREARLEAFLANLPEGLDTRLGEKGMRCSGGERQRIAIARALYDDPSLIVLDEATSALDPATERDILRSLESLRGRRSLLVISQRLSTVAKCDRIVVIRGGRAVSEGTFDDLSRESADFRKWAGLDDEESPAGTPA